MLQKELEDGQVLVAPNPEEGKNVAMFDPARLDISLPDRDPFIMRNLKRLNGFISQQFLEKNGETVQVSVKVAELLITILMDRNRVELLQLYPGKNVIITYDPNDIEWF